MPLVDAGLQLVGLDLSAEALKQLAAQRPALASALRCENFHDFQPDQCFSYLIALQVFQHGNTTEVTSYFNKVATLLKPGGLFFLRVNSSATQIYHAHSVVERNDQGGFTIQYEEGPKRGMFVHFYSRAELMQLTQNAFRIIGELHQDVIQRTSPKTGVWAQWEMIGERL